MSTRALVVFGVICAIGIVSLIFFSERQRAARLANEPQNISDIERNAATGQPQAQGSPPVPTPVPSANADKRGSAPTKEEEDRAISREMLVLQRRYIHYTGLLVLIGVVIGGLQLVILIWQSKHTGKAASAAEQGAKAAVESNKLSRAALVSDQRPWIALDVVPATVLAYDNEGWGAGVRWHITVEYRLQQLGKTPATQVQVHGALLPWLMPQYWPESSLVDGVPHGLPIQGTNIQAELENICSFTEGMATHGIGFDQVIFPHEQPTRQFTLNMNPARAIAALNAGDGYTGQFLVVFAVTYRSTLSDAVKYRTAKAFSLFKPVGSIDLKGEVLLPSSLAFHPHPMNGSLVA